MLEINSFISGKKPAFTIFVFDLINLECMNISLELALELVSIVFGSFLSGNPIQ